ncbi:MAG: Ppx/GppA phosphatase family protein [Phycisphaerales bacterium]
MPEDAAQPAVSAGTPREPTPGRIGAIDVGSNSIRLIVAQADEAYERYRVLDDEKIITRLGAGLSTTGRLDHESMEASILAIGRLKEIAEGYHVSILRAVATSAVREAVNASSFIMALEQHTGVELEVISAEEEARLSYRSVSSAFDIEDQSVAIADVGGGSTEIVVCVGGVIEKVHTLKLGAVRLTERFGLGGDPDDKAYHALRTYLRDTLRTEVDKPMSVPGVMYGTGGTFTALANVARMRGEQERMATDSSANDLLPSSVRGYELHRSEVRHILDQLRGMTLEQRRAVPGLSADRAEIGVAGIAIVDRVMRRLGANRLVVHDGGIRDGLLLSILDEQRSGRKERPSGASVSSKLRSARWFAEKCQYEREHSEHVADIALQLFDQLGERVGAYRPGLFTPAHRELLHAAAMLHDVGYLINYAKHHKHSYHLIVHSGMRGYSQRELEIVANVARYHRRSVPKPKHAAYMRLSEHDREIVRVLSAILRIADGFDRTHTRQVSGVRVEIDKGVARFVATSTKEPAVDLWGAEGKSDLFRAVFDLDLRFDWERTPDIDHQPPAHSQEHAG